ncbi:phosphomevalonate kinase [Streptococcus catagoni]|uniref:phosphomevalonate kinase n=1 Tax=Streptococcus catagoni TaxID=2654874 RepID=UPI001408D30D|nr:phosphomevalonate kinase [Streptococcus catagoni]
MTKYKVETGGKLYLAGEYAILKAGQTAIIKNIPIKMTAEIKACKEISLYSDKYDYVAGLKADENYQLIQTAIETMSQLLGKKIEDLPAFSLSIKGKMEENGKKYGIGSSGSVTVLTLKALAKFYQIELSKDLLFKLAAYSLLKLGDNGSMGDIACIAFEDLIAYRSFDRQLISQRIKEESFEDLLKSDWGYQIEVIRPKLATHFLVGWTKIPSISKDMINLLKAKIDDSFLRESQLGVLSCKKALLENDQELFMASIERLSKLLMDLDPAVYHPKLRELKESCQGIDAVAKSSGSGGGDCGVAFAFSQAAKDTLIKDWEQRGIQTIYQESWE